MTQVKKPTLITGKALASTFKTVSTLGEIGKKILDSAGLNEIDPEGWYLASLRNQMFDEIYDRFGSEVIFIFGLNTVYFHRDVVSGSKKIREIYKDSIALDSTENGINSALWLVNKKIAEINDASIRNTFRGDHGLYGVGIYKNSSTSFTHKTTVAIGKKHEGYYRGGFLTVLSLTFCDEWKIDIVTKSIVHKPELDMTTFEYECSFQRHKNEKTIDELLIDLQIDARDALMRKVVLDSDSSLRKLDASHKLVVESVNYASRLQ